MSSLLDKKCLPCEGGLTPLKRDEITSYQAQFDHHWRVVDSKKITREFKFKNFVQTIEFVNRVAELAESQGHHPDFEIHYNNLKLELWTHAIGGLSQNDFIMAAKINQLERAKQ